MNLFRLIAPLMLAAATSVSLAQSRGSAPPGAAQDGSRPAEGAIKGGAILPGETAGVPNPTTSARGVNRCKQLGGVLREQCLRDLEESASGGGTRAAQPPAPGGIGRDPVSAPPPQNPR